MWNCKVSPEPELASLFSKGQVVNVGGFVGCGVSVPTTQLATGGVKAATDSM